MIYAPLTILSQTPMNFNEVFTLAAGFITSCPSTNPALPFKAFPSLALSAAKPGETATATFKIPDAYKDKPVFVSFLTGLAQMVVAVGKDNTVKVPEGLTGTVYAIVIGSNATVTDAITIAGPAILSYDF